MFTKKFWKATAERAVSTAAQTFGALAIVGSPLDLIELDWSDITVASLIAGGLSVVKALAASSVGSEGPSFSKAETLTPYSQPESLAG